MSEKPTDILEFHSPINMEGSWGGRTLSRKAKSIMRLWLHKDPSSGGIEWEVPKLDLYEEIGLTFEWDDKKQKRVLVDYDGVMSIPDQALDLLERNGIDVSEMR